ncbi:Hypothetical predicted protein [Mytilus galloprovincialis]|uniref:Fibrinogen C-terminal domain-containing protein n=1 Tax=Mytilus galloprovincialis TaxID=29158 RepID=A0A8B6CL36_MYTGA|nr:Hypothetical predicted protein [Mytilus galloprovincialis]
MKLKISFTIYSLIYSKQIIRIIIHSNGLTYNLFTFTGNDNIHVLTTSGRYELRIDLSDWKGNKWFAIYKTFSLGNENTRYELNIGEYSGNAKDGLARHNGMKFSTKDQDNDKSSKTDCAELAKGGWWYASCHCSNLNGIYKTGNTKHWDVVSWNEIKGSRYSMKFARMMIRRF